MCLLNRSSLKDICAVLVWGGEIGEKVVQEGMEKESKREREREGGQACAESEGGEKDRREGRGRSGASRRGHGMKREQKHGRL